MFDYFLLPLIGPSFLRVGVMNNSQSQSLAALYVPVNEGDIAGKEFQGNRALQLEIQGFINHTHASCAQLRPDFVGAKLRARGKGRKWRDYSARTVLWRHLAGQYLIKGLRVRGEKVMVHSGS